MSKAALALALTLSLCANEARATSTRCSNPKREGVRVSGMMHLAWSDLPKLDGILQSSEKVLGMSYSSVESGTTGQTSMRKDFILQSPKVSVAIEIVAHRSENFAKVSIERTCINDDLESWRPYWRRFRALMASKGYPVMATS